MRGRGHFRRDLQGLRAVAVLLVVAHHAGLPVAGGWIGVDVFFVLSGFLITGLLVRELDATGRVDLGTFYARRARRILPAALVVALATALLSVVFVAPLRLPDVLEHGVAAVLSVPNVLFGIQGTDYLGEDLPSPFRHYWSLGVEEQFYLVWPLLLLAVSAVTRRRAALAAALVAVTVGSFVACLAMLPVSQPTAFFQSPFRAWELAVGGVLALLPLARIPETAARAAGWAGLGALLVAAIVLDDATRHPGWATLLPVLATTAVIAGAHAQQGARVLLAARPMVAIGGLSYSLYLVHWPLLVLPHEAVQWHALPGWLDVVLAAAAFPLAWLVHRVVEEPARSLRMPRARTLLAAAAALTVAAVAVAAAGIVATARLPELHSTRAAASAPAPARFVPSDLTPTLAGAREERGDLTDLDCQQSRSGEGLVTCDFGPAASGVTVALVGDSHAGRLFRAFEGAAQSESFTLRTMVKSGCRSVDPDDGWLTPDNPTCGTWRTDMLAAVHADPPDVIVLANHTGVGGSRGESGWRDALEQSIDRLPSSARVVVMQDSPDLGRSPLYCLSANLDAADRCGAERSAALNPAARSAFAAVAPERGAGLVDLTERFCDDAWCPAIIGSTLVYTDDHHLSDDFAASLAPAVADALEPFLTTSGSSFSD